MPVNSNPGDPAANSYASEEEYAVYAANRFPVIAASVALTGTALTASLICACRTLEACFDWLGEAANPAVQALGWPRNGLNNRNRYPIPNTVVPQELKNSQCELVYQVAAGFDLTADNQALIQQVNRVQAGSVSVGFQSQDNASAIGVDMFIRRMGSKFNYVSNAIPGEVRRLLLEHWFRQERILLPIIIDVQGASRRTDFRRFDGDRDE
jgi:hypothetical protein